MSTARTALLVEDEWSVREAYLGLLSELNFQVASADTVEAALESVATVPTLFDLAVLDIRLRHDGEEHPRPGDASGIAIARRVKMVMPNAGILFITSYERYLPYVLELVMQGHTGIGFILKGTKKAMTYEAIEHVLAGKPFVKLSLTETPPTDAPLQFLSALPPTVARAVQDVAARLHVLTERERQIVEHLTSQQSMIARQLQLAPKSVSNRLQGIYEKLGVNEGHEQSQVFRRDMIIMLAVLFQSLQPKGDSG